MLSNGDALLLGRHFITLRISSFKKMKMNSLGYHTLLWFLLHFLFFSFFFFKHSVILDWDWTSKFGCFFNFGVFVMSEKVFESVCYELFIFS